MLWHASWQDQQLIRTFLQLHSYAKDHNISVLMTRLHDDTNIYELFHIPLLPIAVQQLQELI